VIKPTVGRVLWYYETTGQVEPFAAIVAKVHSESLINISYFDGEGKAQSRTSVLLLHEPSVETVGAHCRWMPYQLGQAAKTEQVMRETGR
jgi:hypothetical protein